MSRRAAIAMLGALLALTALAAGCRSGAATSGPAVRVSVTIAARGLPPEFEAAFHEGGSEGPTVAVADSGVTIGDITSVEVTPSVVTVVAADGRSVTGPSPIARDYIITVSGTAAPGPAGWVFAGGVLPTDKDLPLSTKLIAFGGRVLSVTRAGE